MDNISKLSLVVALPLATLTFLSTLLPKKQGPVEYYSSIRLSGLYSSSVDGASFSVGNYRIAVEDYNSNSSWDMVKVEKLSREGGTIYTLYLYDMGEGVKVSLEAFGQRQEWQAEKDSTVTAILDAILRRESVGEDKLKELAERLRSITKEAEQRVARLVLH